MRNIILRYRLAEAAMGSELRYEVILYWSDEDEAFIGESSMIGSDLHLRAR